MVFASHYLIHACIEAGLAVELTAMPDIGSDCAAVMAFNMLVS